MPPTAKTLIFSDVHLKVHPGEERQHREFVSFLRQFRPPEYDRIICLGDLFDFWFEYRHVIFSGYFDVLRAFADLRDAGVELHLICGNHDFWAGRFLREELGFQVHQDGVTLPLGSQRVQFVHGDGINPTDRSYRLYKRFARNPLVVSLFRAIHPDWAMALAQWVSHGSRSLLQEYDPATGPEARALAAYAETELRAGRADVVLCGHAHAPSRIESENGLYLNTGDWLQNRSYVIWDGAGFALHRAGEPHAPEIISVQ